MDNRACPEWAGPGRRWAPAALLKAAIAGRLGTGCRLLRLEVLGARSLLVKYQAGSHPAQLVALRQRSPDSRYSLPLSEERRLLGFLAQGFPGLAPQPLWLCGPGDGLGEEMLFVEYIQGRRLGELLLPTCEADRLLVILDTALRTLHRVGRAEGAPRLSRVASAERLLERAWNGPLSALIPRRHRSALRQGIRAAFEGTQPATILHGDPHAYNLLVSESSHCWLDFELAQTGPPEVDRARLLLTTFLQAGRLPPVPWPVTPAQQAYNLLLWSEWLASPPSGARAQAVAAVRRMVSDTISEFLGSAPPCGSA